MRFRPSAIHWGWRGQRKPQILREFLPNVFPRGHPLRALLDEGIRPPGIFVRDVSGDGKDFAILLECTTGNDARAAVLGSFDD